MQDILIVDDNELVRRALARALEGEGYTVATAGNGREALNDLERAGVPPKIIILDLMMPVMDGWAFRLSLLAHPRFAKVPVIVFSGLGCDDSGVGLPAVRYVVKPASLRDLFDNIAQLISGPLFLN